MSKDRRPIKIAIGEWNDPITASGYCADCPDREGCMQGYPCSMVKRLDGVAGRD